MKHSCGAKALGECLLNKGNYFFSPPGMRLTTGRDRAGAREAEEEAVGTGRKVPCLL